MYILCALIVGIIIGYIRKGSLKNAFSKPYDKWYLGAIGIVLAIFLHLYYLTNAFQDYLTYLPIINFVSYLLILITLIFNLDDIYTILISIGIILNFIVTFLNGGFMPVSENVISIMPLNSVLTQSIYTDSNGVYILMQNSEALLGFLGVVFPIPILSSLVTKLATVAGLSPGDIFLLIGIVGIVQLAMTREEAPNYDAFVGKYESPKKEIQEPKTPKFESKTEELFFEDQLLPENPLDKIFGDDQDTSQTQVVEEFSSFIPDDQVTLIVNENEQTQLLESLEELTRPIRQEIEQSIENDKESTKEIKVQDITETKPIFKDSEEEGYFVSQFFAEREKEGSVNNSERLMTDELFKEDSHPLDFLTSEDLNFDIKSRKKDIFATDPNLSSLDIIQSLNKQTQNIKNKEEIKTDKELVVQTNDKINTVESSDSQEELKNSLETKDSDLETKESKLTQYKDTLSENEELDLSDTEIMQEDKITPEEKQETTENKAIDYDLDALKALLNNTPISEIPEEDLEISEEPVEEEIESIEVEPIEEKTEESEEFTIDSETLKRLEEEAASSKRGSFEEDSKSGYIVNKTYLEDKSSVDNSEEKMRDIWSQVAKETRDRKLGRRRQASSNYTTNNPYEEEMERRRRAKEEKQERARKEREAFLQQQREELSKHAKETERILESTSPNPDTMTDEERIAAGYKLVTFEVAGKKISFWKK